jgi:hypothetical protein
LNQPNPQLVDFSIPSSRDTISIKVLDSRSPSPRSQLIGARLTKCNDNNIEIRRLMLSIQGKLPNVVAAGADLHALRLLLSLQLAEAALLKPYFSESVKSD